MVKIFIYALAITIIPFYAMAAKESFTGKDLQKLLSESEQEHLEHSKEVKSDKLHEYLNHPEPEVTKGESSYVHDGLALPPPVDKKADVTEKKGGKYDFFDGSKASLSGSLAVNTKPMPDPETNVLPDGQALKKQEAKKTKTIPKPVKPVMAKVDQDRYIPPSWSFLGGRKAAPIHSSQAEEKGGPYFGVWMGTEFRAKLARTTTNIDPDWAEFVVADDVFGDFKTLHKHSKLYAKKSVSKSSNRIYFNIFKGITPEGETFKMDATVTEVSSNRLSGLTGTITTDQNLIKRSFGDGVLAAGREFISQAVPDDIVGTATSTAANTALSEKEQEKDATLGEPTFVIFVNPQDVFIRTNNTF